MRVALHSEIRDGHIAGYVEHHRVIPDSLCELFATVGISNWSIWRSGLRLFHLVECDDWDAAITQIENHPANLEWQANIGRFVELFRDSDGDSTMAPLDLVWSLESQQR
jgi:L-rhamnose mutarotase